MPVIVTAQLLVLGCSKAEPEAHVVSSANGRFSQDDAGREGEGRARCGKRGALRLFAFHTSQRLDRRVRFALLLVTLWAGSAAAQIDPDPWFAPDKALHFSVSAGLAGLGYGGTALFSEDRAVRVAVGAGFALSLGIAKELADLAGLGHPSWKDFTWDVAGTAVGLVASWLLDRFVFTPLFPPRSVDERRSSAGSVRVQR